MTNILHVLTVIFVIAKLAAVDPIVTWSWWLVLAPTLISFAIGIIVFMGIILIAAWTDSPPKRRF